MKYIHQLHLQGKRIFLRADLNVPLDNGGRISDYRRVEETLPTIEYALKEGAAVVIASHLGRPQGKVDPRLTLKPVADYLSLRMDRSVQFAADCVGPEARKQAEALKPGDLLLLENLRFHPEEEKNDPQFSKALSELAPLYINDAFGTAHRAHASTFGMVFHMEATAAGFIMEKEIETLREVRDNPPSPFGLILGGAKAEDKIDLISNLLKKVSFVLIGGAIANTFLKASGIEIGSSRHEPDKIEAARSILKKAKDKGIEIHLPPDAIAAPDSSPNAERRLVAVDQLPAGWSILDIGPKTAERFESQIAHAKTLFWNGPMGLFEIHAYREGTQRVAQAMANSSELTVAGGGDTLAAIDEFELHDKFRHVSTGGGASLAYLAGKRLPAIEVLETKL
ncbi:MAG: phosphoglycerate kinase [Deltaproteobacteria bacterium]|nr:phosphoglycerate kinase [Deltaproteobacteria bacterium]